MIVDYTSRPWEQSGWGEAHQPCNVDYEYGLGSKTRVPACECSECAKFDATTLVYKTLTFSDYDNIDPIMCTEFTEHQYMLCWSHVYALILRDRVYGES